MNKTPLTVDQGEDFSGEHFCARGYAVSTAGFEPEQVRKYIRDRPLETVTFRRLHGGLQSGIVRAPESQSSCPQVQTPTPKVAQKNCRKRPWIRRRPPLSRLG